MSDPTFELTGGALCLDFANTLGDRPEGAEEHLDGYGDLVAWARQAGAVSAAEAATLMSAARARPAEAERALGRAVELREAVYRLFRARIRGEPPPAADLARLNRALREARSRQELEAGARGYAWRFAGEPDRLERLLWPVADSAGELLVSERASRVRECHGERCSWLFLDGSRSRRRRWCDMKSCGNRAKARRHYWRQRRGMPDRETAKG